MIINKSDIKNQYDEIRTINNAEKIKRQKLIYKNIPEILELKQEMISKAHDFNKRVLEFNGISDDEIELFQLQMEEIYKKRVELLVENGYPKNYLDDIYTCDKCKDTGHIGNDMILCDCYKAKITEELIKKSNMDKVLKRENFETVNFDIFSDKIEEGYGMSPKKYMQNIFVKAHKYTMDFSVDKHNILLSGPTGTGKTFLTHCIAEELIRHGYTVLYFTVIDMIENIRKANFQNDLNAMSMVEYLKRADLLIIDDLGTELISDYSISELFSVINHRMIREDKATVISTNLTIAQIVDRYSERLSSRLIGNGEMWEFFGKDLRISMKL